MRVVRRALRLSDACSRASVVKTVYLAIRDFSRFFPSSDTATTCDARLVPFGPGKVIGFVTAESDPCRRAGSR
jgi:hypothetical protein